MRYLEIPYKVGGDKHLISITCDGSLYTELTVEAGDNSEYVGYIPLPEGEISLSSSTGLDTGVLRITAEKPEGKRYFSYHYTPSFGWMNDPNGLHYKDGLYHMYYQYNPVSREWNNMSWGHAVSSDLINWKEEDVAMLPLSRNELIFSGSAIEEDEGVVFYYTLCTFDDDSENTQRCRITTDGGLTLTQDKVIIPPVAKGARDPKAFYYNGDEYIILYLDKNDFAIYRKENGSWVQKSVFSAPEAWECPDLFFFADGRCVFTSADGFYWLASFDGEAVTLLSERRNMFLNKIPYASQSFFGTSGRIVMVPWLRVMTPSLPTKGAMGLPREARLDDDGFIHLYPVREFSQLMDKSTRSCSKVFEAEARAYTLKIDNAPDFTGVINGNPVTYRDGKLTISSNEVDFSSSSIILMVDGLIAEVSDSTYLENAYFELEEKQEHITKLLFAKECTLETTVIEE